MTTYERHGDNHRTKAMSEQTTVPLKEHLEKMLEAEKQLREAKQESVQRALELAARAAEHKAERNLAIILAAVSLFGMLWNR